VARWDWPHPGWIQVHFWLTASGVLLYVCALCWAGFLQGRALNNPAIPFVDTVQLTRPYLSLRSLSGILMGTGHLIFAALFAQVLYRMGPRRAEAQAKEAAAV